MRKQRRGKQAGGRGNHDMEGGRTENHFKVQEKAMKEWRHGERVNEAY